MRPKGFGLVFFILPFVLGCSEAFEKIKPDRVSAGVTLREIGGRKNGFQVDTVIPVWEVRAKKAVSERMDLFAKAQYNKGEVAADHPILAGSAEGWIGGVGAGVGIYPWRTRALGLEIGGEYLHAEYEMRGGYGPVGIGTPGKLDAAGINLGPTGEIPLDKQGRFQLVWGAGYNFSLTHARRAEADSGGWYGSLSLQFNPSKKK